MKNDTVLVKTLFGNWKEVTKEQAKDYIEHRLYNLSCFHKKDTFNYINENILNGIKVEELITKDDLNSAIRFEIYGK